MHRIERLPKPRRLARGPGRGGPCGLLIALVAALAPGLGPLAPRAHAEDLPRVILDSDMSSDWDDAGDMGLLHGLALAGDIQILATVASSSNLGTAQGMDAINTFYGCDGAGKPKIPVGVPSFVGGAGNFPAQIGQEFPHTWQTKEDFEDAVKLYRRLLYAAPDDSVTIVTTGYLENLEDLLKSGADHAGDGIPLTGMQLVAQKVRLWACAGGCYPSGDEFNFRVSERDPVSAFYVVNNWPTRAMFVGYDVGQAIYTAGLLPEAPTYHPVRRVYVDIKYVYPYPSWGQVMMLYGARGFRGLWGAVTVGRNNADEKGHNWWTAAPDPTGHEDQGYLLEVVRTPVRATIDALMMLSPDAESRPGQPTDVHATAVGGDRIDLSWTDNSYNEAGFRIERRIDGAYTEIGSVAANVTSYSDTGLASTANASYRVSARNAWGDSRYSYVWVYSGWTEVNFQAPANLPLYRYYQHANLRSTGVGQDHVTVNNDSAHGPDVTIGVDVGALGAGGSFYVYFLYQDQNNWYRLNAGPTASRFEKRIGGATSQVGAAGPGVNIGNGSILQDWRIEVAAAGTLKFVNGGSTFVSVSEALGLTSGRIGLGGSGRAPIWENFAFWTGADPAARSAPLVPVHIAPTGTVVRQPGSLALQWAGCAGAEELEIRLAGAADANAFPRTPVAGFPRTLPATATSVSVPFSDLTDGHTYEWSVVARNDAGVSTSPNARFTVVAAAGDASPPAVTIATPADGATVSGVVYVSGTASDNVGVESVQVRMGNVGAFEDAGGLPDLSAWEHLLDTSALPNGPLVITVRATDASGQQTSATRTVTVDSSVPPAVDLDHPWIWWKLDGDAANSAPTGAAYDGTVQGAAAYVAGKDGQALQFNGTDTLLKVIDNNGEGGGAGNGAYAVTPFTIAVWVNLEGDASMNVVARRRSDNDAAATRQLSTYKDGAAPMVGRTYMNYAAGERSVTGTTPLSPGAWCHLVMVADPVADTQRLFVNGLPDGPTRAYGKVSYRDLWSLGSASAEESPEVGFGWFGGLMDDVRIYRVALADDDVHALYNSYDVAPTAPPAPVRVAPTADVAWQEAGDLGLVWAGGAGADEFEVRLAGAGAVDGFPRTVGAGTTSVAVPYADLTIGQTYTWSVIAANEHGESSPQNWTFAVVEAAANAPPSVAISSPAESAHVWNAVQVSGTASDDVAVASVEVKVGDGTFAPATDGGGWATWTFSFDASALPEGPCVVTVRATDGGGLQATATRTVVVDSEAGGDAGDWVYLSDLDWVSATCGYGTVHRDASTNGTPITLEGVVYDKGLGTHAASEMVYDLGGQYATFRSDVGVDDEEGANGSVAFLVYLDGVLAYESGVMAGASATGSVDLDVAGVGELKLVVTDGGNGISNDHADWADARLSAGGGAPPPQAPTPAISISDVTLEEGESGPTGFTFTVTLSGPSDDTVTVDWIAADGTATAADGDYAPASGTLTFEPGETTATVTVEVTGDAAHEGDETFTVELSGGVNATIADAEGTGTIVGDDASPSGSLLDSCGCAPAGSSAGGVALLFLGALALALMYRRKAAAKAGA